MSTRDADRSAAAGPSSEPPRQIKRILLKISGESLGEGGAGVSPQKGCFSFSVSQGPMCRSNMASACVSPDAAMAARTSGLRA